MIRAPLAFGALAALAGCGIGVGRNLSAKTPSAVVFDDTCALQTYFDALATSSLLQPPTEVFGQELERDEDAKPKGGRTKLLFRSDFQLENLRRVLKENWTRLPPELLTANEVFVEVRWSQKAGVRRVVTTQDAEIAAKGKSWSLPYHVCLSDLLFGSPLYRTRREMLGLPALLPSTIGQRPPSPAPAAAPPGAQAMGHPASPGAAAPVAPPAGTAPATPHP